MLVSVVSSTVANSAALFTVGCAVAVIVTSFYSSAALTGCFKLFQA